MQKWPGHWHLRLTFHLAMLGPRAKLILCLVGNGESIWFNRLNFLFSGLELNVFSVINNTRSTDQSEIYKPFTCLIWSKPDPEKTTVKWFFNKTKLLVNSSNYKISINALTSGNTMTTLQLNNVTAMDLGTYWCEASSSLGSKKGLSGRLKDIEPGNHYLLL